MNRTGTGDWNSQSRFPETESGTGRIENRNRSNRSTPNNRTELGPPCNI